MSKRMRSLLIVTSLAALATLGAGAQTPPPSPQAPAAQPAANQGVAAADRIDFPIDRLPDTASELPEGVRMAFEPSYGRGGAIRIDSTLTEKATIALFRAQKPEWGVCTLFAESRMRSEGLVGQAFLEMQCQYRQDRQGSVTLRSAGAPAPVHVAGTCDWKRISVEINLRSLGYPYAYAVNPPGVSEEEIARRAPVEIELRLLMTGPGTVWIDDVTLTRQPSPAQMTPMLAQTRARKHHSIFEKCGMTFATALVAIGLILACLGYGIAGAFAARRGAARRAVFRTGLLLMGVCSLACASALYWKVYAVNTRASDQLALLSAADCVGLAFLFIVFRWLYRRAELRRMAAMDLP